MKLQPVFSRILHKILLVADEHDVFTHTQMTLSCISTAVVKICRQQLLDMNAASWRSVSECQPIIMKLNRDKTELFCVGSKHRSLQEAYLICRLAPTSSLPMITFVYWA